MTGTRDDEAAPAAPKPSASDAARLARKADALRANLRRRKAQSRGRADLRDDAPPAD